jgi:hypothetical protein
MPSRKTKSSSKPTFGRNGAPFAPLALALVVGALLPGGPTKPTEANVATETEAASCTGDITDFQECHSTFPTGCSPSAGYDAYLNLLKNQLTPPPAASQKIAFLAEKDYQKLDQGLPSGLTAKNHRQFKDAMDKLGEGQLFGVVGYLYYYKASGAESSNCELDKKGDPEATNVDFHIGIGFDPDNAKKVLADPSAKGTLMKTLETSSVIVEMTPHYRATFENKIWTLDSLKKAVGHQVKVVGQLMADSEHNDAKDNCALPNHLPSCWRASIWELHPVVQLQVCKKEPCKADSTDGWAELDEPLSSAPATTPSEAKTSTTKKSGSTGKKPAKPTP